MNTSFGLSYGEFREIEKLRNLDSSVSDDSSISCVLASKLPVIFIYTSFT